MVPKADVFDPTPYRVVVLGAGRVGREIARDLSSAFAVTAVDRDALALARAFEGTKVETLVADLADPAAVARVVVPFDLVVEALPGALGFRALEAVIEAEKDVVDIAFAPEDPLRLDDLARARGVTALVDFGVAPGMSNVLLAHEVGRPGRVLRFECLVGGLPVARHWPFEYKATFSPADVIDEYNRPARLVEGGEVVVRPALSDVELVDFEGLGTLEAFNTDGLRTLIHTQTVPEMKEKTLRYPGHARLMEVLREVGFFSEEHVDVGGTTVRPRDLTAALLFPRWQFEEGEKDLTVMRVTVDRETEAGRPARVVWTLLDVYDDTNGVPSMARTTGYACAAAVHLVARGAYDREGISAPEDVGADGACFDALLDYQAQRGVVYRRTEEQREA